MLGPDASPDVDTPELNDAGPVVDSPPTDAASATCEGITAPATADETITITAGGQQRSFHLHLPPSFNASAPIAVVLNLHGWMQTAEDHRMQSKLNETADREGFVTVHPVGIETSWNAGKNCCGVAQSTGIDDVGFIDALLARLQDLVCADSRRIYATGMSNGGFMAHRLACERADVFAAVSSVAGLIGVEPCTPSRPVPVLTFHGTADFIVGYTMSFTGLAGAPMTIERWRAMNGCADVGTVVFATGDVSCERWMCQAGSEVEFCTIADGGHTWPGGTPTPLFGKTTTNISASDYLWDFFERHPLP